MKMKSKFLLCILLTIGMVLLHVGLYFGDNQYTASDIQPVNGLIRLTESDLEEHSLIFLCRDWQVYPDALLSPEDFSSGEADTLYSRYIAPGEYGGMDLGDPSAYPRGSMTYRLNLSLPEESNIYSLLLPTIYSSYRLYINDELVLTCGNPDPDQYEESVQQQVVSFEASGMTRILVAVTDRTAFYSGMNSPPVLGTPNAVNNLVEMRNLIRSIFLLLNLFLIVVYLYLYIRSRQKIYCIILLACLCIGVYLVYPLVRSFFSAGIYLNYAISQNWVNTSGLTKYLEGSAEYSDAGETYQAMTEYIQEALSRNNAFDKLIYQYMIKAGSITGRQICMMIYEQGVLKYDEDQYNRLASGSLGAYDFLRGKIKTLEITPGQLGLEPCTGSLVMTDPNTGDVLACVSYPGYDNNRLANTMDSEYYNKLVTDQARPFYNNATQEKTAPGSTYKPLVAVAGLMEGVIDVNSQITCRGVYKKVEPNPKCWIYPRSHGTLDVSGGIQNSCNCFFYETGYRLSLKDNGLDHVTSGDLKGEETSSYYSSDLGTDTLAKYAAMFGLGTTSGVEIPEAEPEISDESSVPSAIGQGTNNYTTTQLARYVTAVANKGTVYDLTLLDKVTTVDGEVLKEYEPKVANTLSEVPASAWNAIHTGMRNVVLVSQSKIFTELNRGGVEISGKTGTAQQSKSHPDHGLFVGFAQSSDPEVAFAIRIANGYSSTYAAEVGRDIMKYYYETDPVDEIITGEAAEISETTSGD